MGVVESTEVAWLMVQTEYAIVIRPGTDSTHDLGLECRARSSIAVPQRHCVEAEGGRDIVFRVEVGFEDGGVIAHFEPGY